MVPLTATERADLRNAAISANLANPFSRQALFANVHPAFVATIPFARRRRSAPERFRGTSPMPRAWPTDRCRSCSG